MSSRPHPRADRGAHAARNPKATISDDDLARFNASLVASAKAAEAAKRSERDRLAAERQAADEAAAHDKALATARRELEQAIAAVRSADGAAAKVEADTRWKAAKARLIELETGAAPTWAPASPPPDESAAEATDASDAEAADASDAEASDGESGDAGDGEASSAETESADA